MSIFPSTKALLLAIGLLVLGALSGIARLPIHAGLAAEGAIEFGNASGEPGEVVAVAVLATFDLPLRGLVVVFTLEGKRLELLGFTTEGSEAAGTDPLAIFYRTFGADEGICGILPERKPSLGRRYAPGVRKHMGSLLFRIRPLAAAGVAAVTPVPNIGGTAGGTSLEVAGDSGFMTLQPESFVGGAVTVLPPAGPRPVDALRCEQFLDRIQISFTPTEPYDSIAVRRDGEPIATLSGSATSFTDPLVGLGRRRYAVVASRGGKPSVAAGCEVTAVSPAAPPVKDLRCGEDGLTWTNPHAFDRIHVFRNGEEIAQLAGGAQGFADPERPDSLTAYTVIAEVEGFRSPEVNCLDHGVWIMEIGDVQAPLDAQQVSVPIFVTTSGTVQGWEIYLNVRRNLLSYLPDEYEAQFRNTVGWPDPEYFHTGYSGAFQDSPAAGIIYDFHNPKQEEKDLPVGLRQHVFNFTFGVPGTASDGTVIPILAHAGSFTLRGAVSRRLDALIPGQVRFGSGGPAAVKGLKARVGSAGAGGGGGAGPATVSLSWDNGSVYERILIERNGTRIADVPGTARTHVDRDVATGVYTYKVSGVQGGLASFPASALLSTIAPRGAFLRGDSNRDGKVNIADPINTLNFLYRAGGLMPCQDAADADDDGRIALTDSILTLNYIFHATAVLRAPGPVHAWFDPTPDGLGCAGE